MLRWDVRSDQCGSGVSSEAGEPTEVAKMLAASLLSASRLAPLPQVTLPAAEHGSALHKLLQLCVITEVPPMKWLAFFALMVVVLNLISSFCIFRINDQTGTQRLLQLAVVWLLPVIGAVLCLAFATSLLPAAARGQATDAGMMAGDIPGHQIAGVSDCSDAVSCDGGGGDGGGD